MTNVFVNKFQISHICAKQFELCFSDYDFLSDIFEIVPQTREDVNAFWLF